MKIAAALLVSALFSLPAVAWAQSASPSPTGAPALSPAPSASPAPVDTASLTVPHDWLAKHFTANMGSFVLMDMWYRPNGGGDNIELGYSPNPDGGGIAQVVPLVRVAMQRMVGAANVTDHAEKACNGTADGWLFSSKMTMGAFHLIVEEVILPSKHQTFGAAYTRNSTHPEDPAARKSLNTLCVKA